MRLDLEGLVTGYHGAINEGEARILQACFDYAFNSIGQKIRKTGGSYFRHPWDVARELADRKLSPLILGAALNHDTPEELGGKDPEALRTEIHRFRAYLEDRLGNDGTPGHDFSGEIDFVVNLVQALTNMHGKDYIAYLKDLFAIPDKILREAALMIKAADMIDNITDIGTQDRFASASNLRGHFLNAWGQVRWHLDRANRHFHEYHAGHYLSFAREVPAWSLRVVRKVGSKARDLARDGLIKAPRTLYHAFNLWLHNAGFPGHEINKRSFKNICFLYLFKEYLKQEGMITPDPYEYDELDNVVGLYRRLAKVTEKHTEGVANRIYGIGMRHGNHALKASLDEARWQLGHEEFGFGTLDRRTGPDQCHIIHPPAERRSSSYAPAGSIEELEKDYVLLRRVAGLKKQARGLYHGVIDQYFRSLIDKKELLGVADDPVKQYAHAKAFCEIIKKIRNDYEYELEAFL